MKKVLLVVLAILMTALAVISPVSAAAVDNGATIQPLWTNTNALNCDVTYVDGMGYAECAVSGKFGTTAVAVDMYIYEDTENGFEYVTEMHETQYQKAAVFSCPFETEVGTYCRVDYTFTVTKGGVDEIITRTIYETISTSV